MDENQDRTKEVLENIDSESDAIKITVYESQKKLLETLVTIIENYELLIKNELRE